MQGPTEALETLAKTPGSSAKGEAQINPHAIYTPSELAIVTHEGSTGGPSCKECGNQAKKDCQYQRCRTCCKGRGFDCSTHVKSTWVPVSKRKERLLAADGGISSAEQLSLVRSKRPRSTHPFAGVSAAGTSFTATSPLTSPHGSDINSSQPSQSVSPRKGTFPPEIRSHAIFKCVRVTGVEDGDEEFAYQVTVKIGGHIFKGVLYDQGLEKTTVTASLADLQLGGRTAPLSSALVDSSALYGPPGTLLGEQRLRQSEAGW